MAQIFNWDRQGFESTYWKYHYKLRGCGAARPKNCRCHDEYVSYSRKFFETNEMFRERAVKITKKLDLPKNSTILVAGCALGYLMEEFKKIGMIPYGFDNSSYIRGVKNTEKVQFDIPSIDLLSNTFKNDINRAFGISEFDCVITEDVLPSHDSYIEIFANCESVLKPNLNKNKIVHIVQTNAGAPFVSKTLNEWKQLNANHTWLNEVGSDN